MEEDQEEVKTPEQMVEDARFDRPIPGQSLTNSPDNPMPFERPPEFVNYEKAQEYVFETLLNTSDDIIDLVSMGMPVSAIASAFVMKGFAEGKWNPDLLLLLIEPAMYTVLFICEQAGVEYVLDFDEEFEHLPAKTRIKVDNHLQKIIKDISKDVEDSTEGADIKDLLPPSLLSKIEASGVGQEQGVM